MKNVNDWIDANTKIIGGKRIRVIETSTGRGVGDKMIFYMNRNVVNHKITSRFIFLYVE